MPAGPRAGRRAGDAEAQYNLGLLYAQGDSLPQDAGRAAVWYRKAAEQGLAEARYSLGVLYHQGNGVPKDAGQAASWVRKAAEQGTCSPNTS